MACISKLLLLCLLFFLLYFPVICSLFLSNLSSNLCDKVEVIALLQFKNSVHIDPAASPANCPNYYSQASYAKIRSWKKDIDCCQWDGITCDPLSGHVIGLDLSCSQLTGPVTSNNSIFLLHRLQSLNLGFNNFNSYIPHELSQFSHLEYLNLSYSGFFGSVPSEIAQLSQLRFLDLRSTSIIMPNFGEIIANLTELRELTLRGVAIDSIIPQSFMNLSSLTSLRLFNCSLQGKFSEDILQLPHLRVLHVTLNELLYANFTQSSNWSSPLEELHLSACNFFGRLPNSLPHPESLRDFNIGPCNFYGVIPTWVWNIIEVIDLGMNNFNSELPSAVNIGSLSTLSIIFLAYNSLSGMLPPWLFNLPLLQELILTSNQFSGELNHINNGNNSLEIIDLSYNKIYGSIPKAIFGLTSLTYLHLRSNNLSGNVELNRISQLRRLWFLDISVNSLSVTTTNEDANFTITWPQLIILGLSFCNITEFQSFLRSQENLSILDLSYNNIHGEVPKWLHDVGKESMIYLYLSQNSLTGGLEDLRSWPNLRFVSIKDNRLQGPMPILPLFVQFFIVSNNSLTGEIPLSICNLTILRALDLSHNQFSGEMPQCIGNLNYLQLLNLGLNNLHGSISWSFGINSMLTTLVLNRNRLEGQLPRSLVNCTQLKLLDLGNNKLNDTFPNWLGALPELQILMLHSNNFHSRVRTSKEEQQPFPKLQILDLSDNTFRGIFPSRLLNGFKAMMVDNEKDDALQYIGEYDAYNNVSMIGGITFSYGINSIPDSIVLTFKGVARELNGVLTTLAAIDLSSNRFRGAIPYSIGELVLVRYLNLSHNNFTGSIPQSLANLNVIESLDLSSNQLTGQIPKELVNLHFLVNFSVADNKLDGAIPHGEQFNLFENSSYLGNIGLCGDPLSKKCGEDGSLPPQPPPAENNLPSTDLDEWKIILMGYGCGLITDLIAGYYIFLARTPPWLMKLMHRIKFVMARASNNQQRQQQQ